MLPSLPEPSISPPPPFSTKRATTEPIVLHHGTTDRQTGPNSVEELSLIELSGRGGRTVEMENQSLPPGQDKARKVSSVVVVSESHKNKWAESGQQQQRQGLLPFYQQYPKSEDLGQLPACLPVATAWPSSGSSGVAIKLNLHCRQESFTAGSGGAPQLGRGRSGRCGKRQNARAEQSMEQRQSPL